MADKRISQLVERVDIANDDVLPIVASGATTTNKVTISTLQDWMQENVDVGVTSVGITIGSTGTDVNVTGSPVTSSGNITINIPTASATNRGLLSSANWTTFNNKVSSVGLSMPSAFAVANSPITGSGTIAVTGAGTVSQYIRGDGSLADFPSGGGGGGASVNYYLNGSVSQGTIGGIAYLEMNKTPILGSGTDFTINANGYIASFITDAGDPALLEIPGGNWNFETYFQASSGGGTPSFYVELYKVNSGGTATLIASNSANPELIAFGTTTTPYFSTLAVPTTTLALTDRLALRYYVTHAGRTITLHTENGNLCQIITTFTTGLTALNGLTAQVQNFATGTSGTDFAISSSVSTHTFNLPNASASARGVVTTGTQTFAGIKNFSSTIVVNQDIQLAATGTASTTFIKNINGAGLTSIGSNGFGFNNSDNIYFSGSNKGGGVFAFNNTGNRTYTLQDASGTLAFTSQIPTNPVGGTGTANIIPKFTGGSTLGDSSLQNVSNSISNLNPPSGQFAWQLNGNATTGQSFGALVVAGTNASDIAFAVRNTGGVTTLFEVQGDGNVGIGTNSPDVTGFGWKTLTIKGGTASGEAGVLELQSPATTGAANLGIIAFLDGSNRNAQISGVRDGANNSGALSFVTWNAGTGAERLRIASTGAATFSSSVTANSTINGYLGTIAAGQTPATSGTTPVNPMLNLTNNRGVGMYFGGSYAGNYAQWIQVSDTGNLGVNYPLLLNPNGGNVGIGTASPTVISGYTTLSVNNNTNSGIFEVMTNNVPQGRFFANPSNYVGLSAVANIALVLATNDTERMRITAEGKVQLGPGTPDGLLTIVSSTTALSAVTNSDSSVKAGYFWHRSDSGDNQLIQFFTNQSAAQRGAIDYNRGAGLLRFVTTSDKNLKNIIGDSDGKKSIEILNSTKIREYSWKDDETEKVQIGIIAQELYETYKGAVSVGSDEELLGTEDYKPWAVDKTAFAFHLIAGWQEHEKQIKELQEQIDSLKNQIK